MPNYTHWKMAISDFQIFWFRYVKFKIYIFKINIHKIENFEDILKPEYMLKNYVPTTGRYTEFQANVFIFVCAMAPKTR